MRPHVAFLGVAVLASCSHARLGTTHLATDLQRLTPAVVARDFHADGLPPITEETLLVERVALQSVTVVAAAVTILGPVPPPRGLYIEEGGRWIPCLINREPVEEGVLAALRRFSSEEVKKNPLGAARDLAKLVVDSSTEYAVVLSRLSDIPVDRRNSDRLRDLQSAGLTRDAIEASLLELVSFPIEAPHLDGVEPESLTFMTWSYFGGLITRWTFPLGDDGLGHPSAEVLARETGSFTYPM